MIQRMLLLVLLAVVALGVGSVFQPLFGDLQISLTEGLVVAADSVHALEPEQTVLEQADSAAISEPVDPWKNSPRVLAFGLVVLLGLIIFAAYMRQRRKIVPAAMRRRSRIR